jgi:hypothetical protein
MLFCSLGNDLVCKIFGNRALICVFKDISASIAVKSSNN